MTEHIVGFAVGCALCVFFFWLGWTERGMRISEKAAYEKLDRVADALSTPAEPRCPKCGLVPDCWTPMYCAGSCAEHGVNAEHVHWTCSRCHYGRIEKTQEQKDKEAASANIALSQALTNQRQFWGPSVQGPCPTCLRYGP